MSKAAFTTERREKRYAGRIDNLLRSMQDAHARGPRRSVCAMSVIMSRG
jgi:hypothetical protein